MRICDRKHGLTYLAPHPETPKCRGEKGSCVYRALRWLCSRPKQYLIIVILWRMRALSEDRTALKQENRRFQARIKELEGGETFLIGYEDPPLLAKGWAIRVVPDYRVRPGEIIVVQRDNPGRKAGR